MFKRLEGDEPGRTVALSVDGRPLTARADEPLAMALLNAGVLPFRRTALSGEPRAPLCLMGVCFDCLVEVDGRASVQACLVPVREGMRVRLPRSAPAVPGSESDPFPAADSARGRAHDA